MIAVAGIACDEAVEPMEWYLGTEIIDKGTGTITLTVIALRYHSPAREGTIVLFECERALLDDGLRGIEVPTVGGRASVDVTPPPGEDVWVTFTLPGEIEQPRRWARLWRPWVRSPR